MAISASDIQKIVATEDDFGHELRVGAAARAIPSFKVQHGGTYSDPVTGKPRQFDYRCSLTKECTKLLLAVECKNLNPSFPLVICGLSREEAEAFQNLIEAAGPEGSVVGPRSQAWRAAGNQSFYRRGDFVGKSLLRLKPESVRSTVAVAGPDSDIYEKWAQALSSAVELAERACRCSHPGQTVVSAVLPIVVVPDESLWKVAYATDGRIASAPEKVGQCEFYIGREIRVNGPAGVHAFTFSHIHFFTLTDFGSFLSKMAINKAAWERLFDPGLLRFGPG